MIKKLTYFNLVFGTIYFFQVINAPGPIGIGDQICAVGLIFSIWYNWETLKLINRQKTKLSKLTLAIGAIVILFGGLLVADNIQRFYKSIKIDDSVGVGGLLLLIGLEFVFAATIIVQAIWAVRKHSSLKALPPT